MKSFNTFTDEELIMQLRAGETEIADYLMDKYKNLVRQKAHTLYLAGGDHEDLLQEGMLGLFKAVREYNLDKEASFYTYASTCITNQMYKAITSSMRQKHQPLNDSLSLNELEQENAWQLVNEDSPEKILIDQERNEQITQKIEDNLSPFENEVLCLYLKGFDYLQISERLARSAKSVDNALQRIRKKVREINFAIFE